MLLHLRDVFPFAGELWIRYCDSVVVYNAIVADLLPRTWAVLRSVNCDWLCDGMALLSEAHQVASFLVWSSLFCKYEFSDVAEWGWNLEGVARNPPHKNFLSVCDEVLVAVVVKVLLGGQARPDELLKDFFGRVIERCGERLGILQSFPDNEAVIRVAMAQSLCVGFPISGRARGPDEGIWLGRIAVMTGVFENDPCILHRVDPLVGKLHHWTAASALSQFKKVGRAVSALPPPTAAPPQARPQQPKDPPQPLKFGGSFAVLLVP